jgi:serine phosphatase RsbU (regulator of sigma subunit)
VTPSLRRLLAADVGQLLDDTTAAFPNLKVAIVDVDGNVLHASGGLSGESVSSASRRLDLAPRGERLGSLVAVGDTPEPVLNGLRRSISLLLGELLDKQDLARETLERYRELNLLYRVSETIGACLNAAEVPRLLLAETERVIPASIAAVLLGEPASGAAWQVAETKGSAQELALLRSATAELIEKVSETGHPDIATWPAIDAESPQSALCVPVRASEAVLGTMVLGRTSRERPFTAGDEKLLLGLAGQAGIALERAKLVELETRRQRLEEELAVAHRIQLTLLPSRTPVIPGWSFAATYEPARQVGGDFYDFLDHALGARRVGLVIADVTGKGVPAALMMAYSRAVVRAESMAGHPPPDVLARANRVIMQERQSRLFLSCFYAELDLDSGLLTYANAGHDAPLWIVAADGTCRELEGSGVILGAFGDVKLEAREVRLAAGDSVVFYTDGVTEARDPEGQLFGEERLAAAVTGKQGGADRLLESVVGAVGDFTAGADQADDLTIVVVQRDGG